MERHQVFTGDEHPGAGLAPVIGNGAEIVHGLFESGDSGANAPGQRRRNAIDGPVKDLIGLPGPQLVRPDLPAQLLQQVHHGQGP